MDHAVPVKGDYYNDVLRNKLRPALQKERPGLLDSVPILLHDKIVCTGCSDDILDSDSEGSSEEIPDIVRHNLVSDEEDGQLYGSEGSEGPVAATVSFPNVTSPGRQIRSS